MLVARMAAIALLSLVAGSHFAAAQTPASGGPVDAAGRQSLRTQLIALAEPFEKRWVVCSSEGRLTINPEISRIPLRRQVSITARIFVTTFWFLFMSRMVSGLKLSRPT